MTKPPVAPSYLRKAVEIFKELGWDGAEISDAPTLPLGTPQQQELALKGLGKGSWEKWVDDHRFSLTGVSDSMLAMFAIRCGVSAKRAAKVLESGQYSYSTVAECIAQRGLEFAREFIAVVAADVRWEDDFSVELLGVEVLPLLLVLEDNGLDLEVPPHANYLRDWAALTAYAFFGSTGATFRGQTELIPSKEVLLSSLRAHVEAAVEQGVPLWGALGYALCAGLENGVFSRDEAIGYAVAAVNAPARPSEHKRCVELLCGDLAITDDEVRVHAETLGALISSGDAVLIDAIGAQFFTVAAAAQIVQVAVGALYASTQKAQVVVLQGLAARGDLTEELLAPLAPRLQEFVAARNKQVAKLATGLLDQVSGQAKPATPLNEAEALTVTWEPVPPVWEVARFEVGQVDVDALVAAQQVLSLDQYDSELERFFVILAALGQKDPQAAQRYIDTRLLSITCENLGVVGGGLGVWVIVLTR